LSSVYQYRHRDDRTVSGPPRTGAEQRPGGRPLLSLVPGQPAARTPEAAARVDLSAVGILRRLGVAASLLDGHRPTATGDCGGPHHTPTRWPCELTELCRAALDREATPGG
jgi:hypothetical protein